MCRFTLYLGPPVRLATLLTEPEHSLILQSFSSTDRRDPLNGDGFGIGWYAPRVHDEPGLFHQATPAWSSRNLFSLARVITSPCVFAHVRAASPGSAVSLANCHPFGYGPHLLMHNGEVGSFRAIRRLLLEGLSDRAFDVVQGSTDSEHLFAVFVDEVIRLGDGPGGPAPPADRGDEALALATRLSGAVTRVLGIVRHHGGGERSRLNVAVTDGRHVAVCRFDTHPDADSESLYLLHGEMYEPAGRHYDVQRPDDETEAMVVSSERLTSDERWRQVPQNHMVVLDRRAPPRMLPMDATGRMAAA